MPDLGVPAGTAATHTATHEWQSFEMRMRQRRAERCLLRAEAALEAGFEEEARAAIDEARRLSPDVPEFDTLRERVAVRAALAAQAQRSEGRRRMSVVAAAVALVVILAAAGINSMRDRAPEGASAASTPPADTVVVPTRGSVPGPAAAVVARQGGGEQVATPPDAGDRPAPVAQAAPIPGVVKSADPKPSSPVEVSTAATPEPLSATATSGRTSDVGLPAVSIAPEPPPVTVLRDPPAAPPAVQLGEMGRLDSAIGALPTVAVPVAAASRDDETAVREALAGYEAAFSTLSAPAAARVWPSVDTQALARAFDGLESQRVRLGRCAVSVSDTRASADCNGTVTWTPRIGGGSFTAGRRWLFELTRAGERWEIARADAR